MTSQTTQHHFGSDSDIRRRNNNLSGLFSVPPGWETDVQERFVLLNPGLHTAQSDVDVGISIDDIPSPNCQFCQTSNDSIAILH